MTIPAVRQEPLAIDAPMSVGRKPSGNVTLVSPSFQRPYAWVRGACANVLAACRGDDTQLFQRAVVTMDIAEGGDARKELLIDGNHRITTVLATLLAVRDALGRLERIEKDEPFGGPIEEVQYYFYCEPEPCTCDLNADGRCDMRDWLLFGRDWGRTDCPVP